MSEELRLAAVGCVIPVVSLAVVFSVGLRFRLDMGLVAHLLFWDVVLCVGSIVFFCCNSYWA